MVINQDFREFIQSLNDNQVKYLVIGGYAVAFHGHPRYTKDLDVWIWPEHENVNKLLKALGDFGFASLGFTVDDFINPDDVVQLGYPPNRIDLLTELQGVEFEPCYHARVEAEVDGTKIYFMDLEHLKRNKEATGRNQDLADLDNLV